MAVRPLLRVVVFAEVFRDFFAVDFVGRPFFPRVLLVLRPFEDVTVRVRATAASNRIRASRADSPIVSRRNRSRQSATALDTSNRA